MPPYRIIALGDSLTYGYPFGKTLSWVEITSQEIGLPILNQGVNGDTLAYMLRRLMVDVVDLRPEFCILLAGTNDVYHEVDFELMKSNCTQITERLLENKILPLLGLPPPTKDPVFEKALTKFRNWLKRHARASSLKTIDFHKVFLDKRKRILPNYLEDGVHPTSKGYQAMAESSTKVLSALLEK